MSSSAGGTRDREKHMAEYTAIYEAANSVIEYLRDTLTPEPISSKELISLCSPYEPENNQLTVYVYNLEEDPAVVNEGFVNNGLNSAQMSPTSLQAGLLITAHSNAPAQMKEADRCRIIGAVVSAIKDMPIIDKKYLTGSLLKSDNQIKMNMEHVTHENMMKIWGNTTPFKLSVVVNLTGIQIDSGRSKQISRVTEVRIGTEQKPQDPKQ